MSFIGSAVGGLLGGGGGGGGGSAAPASNTTVVQKQNTGGPLLASLMNSAISQSNPNQQQNFGQQLQQLQQPQQMPRQNFGQQMMQLQIPTLPPVGSPSATDLAAHIAGQTIGRWGQEQQTGLGRWRWM